MTAFAEMGVQAFELFAATHGVEPITWRQGGVATAVTRAVVYGVTRVAEDEQLDSETAMVLVLATDVPAPPSPGLEVDRGAKTGYVLNDQDANQLGQAAMYHVEVRRKIRRGES